MFPSKVRNCAVQQEHMRSEIPTSGTSNIPKHWKSTKTRSCLNEMGFARISIRFYICSGTSQNNSSLKYSCSRKQTFAACKIFFEGTLVTGTTQQEQQQPQA